MKLLAVDDSSVIRKIIRTAAESLDFDFAEAEDGQSALDILRGDGDVSVVLLDWNMPGKNGMEVLKEIKGDPELCGLPVMMVTTESDRKNMVAAIRAGAANYLTKPFSVEDLLKRILECCGEGPVF